MTGPQGLQGASVSTYRLNQGLGVNDPTAKTGYYVLLGTWTGTESQLGHVLWLRVVSHNRYNALPTQNQVTDLYFKMSNQSSTLAVADGASTAGTFYGDGTAAIQGGVSRNALVPSRFVIVQLTQQSFQVFADFTGADYYTNSYYSVECTPTTSWTHVGTYTTTQPSGNTASIPVSCSVAAIGLTVAGTIPSTSNVLRLYTGTNGQEPYFYWGSGGRFGFVDSANTVVAAAANTASFLSNLYLQGNVTHNGNFRCAGTATLATIDSAVNTVFNNAPTFNGAVQCNSTVAVSGTAVFSSKVTLNGGFEFPQGTTLATGPNFGAGFSVGASGNVQFYNKPQFNNSQSNGGFNVNTGSTAVWDSQAVATFSSGSTLQTNAGAIVTFNSSPTFAAGFSVSAGTVTFNSSPTFKNGFSVDAGQTVTFNSTPQFPSSAPLNLLGGFYSTNGSSSNFMLPQLLLGLTGQIYNYYAYPIGQNLGFYDPTGSGSFVGADVLRLYSFSLGYDAYFAFHTAAGLFYRSSSGIVWRIANSGQTYFQSDRRLKQALTKRSDYVARCKQLQVWEFEYRDAPGIRREGLVAQEVRDVFPQFVQGDQTDSSHLMLTYDSFIPILLGAICELIPRVEALEADNAALRASVARLQTAAATQEQRLAQLEATVARLVAERQGGSALVAP